MQHVSVVFSIRIPYYQYKGRRDQKISLSRHFAIMKLSPFTIGIRILGYECAVARLDCQLSVLIEKDKALFFTSLRLSYLREVSDGFYRP